MEWVSLAQQEGVYSQDVSAIHMHFVTIHASNSVFLLAPHIKATFGIDVFEEEQIERFTDAIISLFLTDPDKVKPARDSSDPGLADFISQEARID